MFSIPKKKIDQKWYLSLCAYAVTLVVIFFSISIFVHTESHASSSHTIKHKKFLKKQVYKRSIKRAIVRVKPKRIAFSPSLAQTLGLHRSYDPLDLHSSVALVIDQQNQEVLFEKNSHVILPIASITKLMTALVVIESNQLMAEILTVGAEDRDTEKGSSSRLYTGMQLTRGDFLLLALMASENRAAFTLASHYPGGRSAFITAMNHKAQELNMTETYFEDPTGLSSRNVSSAADLVKLVSAAYMQPIIRDFSTRASHDIYTANRFIHFINTNRLIHSGEWDIGLQKTGYISEAGRCLVMQATVQNRPVVMVFLASMGIVSRFTDALRIRHWLEKESTFASHIGQL